MDLIYILDLAGTFVFAISGFVTASQKKLDLFGGAVIAFVTALGGGTIRDVLLGATPVGWMHNLSYLLVVACGIVATYLLHPYLLRLRRTLFLFDTIGIGLFTILGLNKTLELGLSPVIAIMMGTVSAVFGGVLRDMLTGEVPLIFRKEIYATACIAGGLLFLGLKMLGLGYDLNVLLTVLFIIVLRMLAVKWHWGLPGVRVG